MNELTILIVEGVSKLSFQCGSRDAINRVSTTGLANCLTLNMLYAINAAETRHATSLRLGKIAF